MFSQQPIQNQSSFQSELGVEVYIWKTGKNPNLTLFPSINNTKTENVTLLEVGLPVESVACGDGHMIFKSEGKLYAMGENSDGRLGISKRNVRSSNTPLLISPLSNFRVLKVACGSKHTVALVETGDIYAWGYGADGQLGLKNELSQFSPQHVRLDRSEMYAKPEENVPAIDINCGANHTAVVAKSGDIYTFGAGELGQLGNGKKSNEFVPFKIKIPNERAEKIVCGKFHTLVLTARGSVYGFGLNTQGQLGLGHRKNIDIPHRISFLDKFKLMKIQAGTHSAGLTFMGELYVWGPCVLGECLVPQRVCRNLEASIVDVQIGSNFTSVLDLKGYLWGLGAQRRGEVGIESIEARSQACPVTFLNNKKIKMVSCTRDAAVILAEKRTKLSDTSMLSKARSMSPQKTERDSSRPGQRYIDMQNSIRTRMYSPQVRPGGFKSLGGLLKAWKQGDRNSSSTEPNHTEMSFSKGNGIPIDAKDRSDVSNDDGQGKFQVREFSLEREREPEFNEKRKNVAYRIMNIESDITDSWRNGKHMATEIAKGVSKVEEIKELSSVKRNNSDIAPFVELNPTQEEEHSKTSIERSLSELSQRKETSPSRIKDHISLEDVMNQVESMELQEENHSYNKNSQEEQGSKEYENQNDHRNNQSDSRMSDLMGDIKTLRAKNTLLESQIEMKAKEIALLESKVDDEEEIIDEKPRLVLTQLEGQIALAKSLRIDSPLKGIEVSFQDESPKSVMKEKDSALIDSLIQENRNLKGLVSYLVKAKGIKIDENTFLSGEKASKELEFQSQENPEFKSDSEASENTLNLKNSFNSQNRTGGRDESPKSIRSSPHIEEFIVAPAPGQRRKGSRSPARSRSRTSQDEREEPLNDEDKILKVRKLVKSFSVNYGFESDRLLNKSPNLRKANSVIISDESSDVKVKKSIKKLVVKVSKKRSTQRSQSVLRNSISDKEVGLSRHLKKSSSGGNESSFELKPKNSQLSKRSTSSSPQARIPKKRKLARSQTEENLLGSSERKMSPSRSLRKINSVILNDKPFDGTKKLKPLKKIVPKIPKKRKTERSQSVLRDTNMDYNKELRKLRKANSLIPSSRASPSSPKRLANASKQPIVKNFRKTLSRSHSRDISLSGLDSGRKDITRTLRKTNSFSDASFASSPNRSPNRSPSRSPRKLKKKSSTKAVSKSQSKNASLLLDSNRKQQVPRKLKKSNSLVTSSRSLSPLLKPKSPKKSHPKSPKKSIKRSKSREASLLLDSSRKQQVLRKLKKSNSLATSSRSLSPLLKPKSPKKSRSKSPKKGLKRSKSREASLIGLDSERKNVTRNLRKAYSLVMNTESSSSPNSPKRSKSPKKIVIKKKSSRKSPTKDISLQNLDSGRKNFVRDPRKARSLVISDNSFANSPKRSKSPTKLAPKSPKKSVKKSLTKQASLQNIDSGRKQQVTKKLRKSNSLVPSDKPLTIFSKKPSSPKKSGSKSPKKIIRSRSREVSLIGLDSERKSVTKNLRKAHSLVIKDESSFASSPKRSKNPKKIVIKKKSSKKSPTKDASLQNIGSARKVLTRNSRKAHSLVFSDASFVSSTFRSKTPVTFGSKSQKKPIKKSPTKKASLQDLDSARKEVASALRKTHSLIMSEASFASSPKRSNSPTKLTIKSLKKKNTKKVAKEDIASLSILDKKDLIRKLKKANSQIVTDKVFIVGNPQGNKSPKKSSSPNRSFIRTPSPFVTANFETKAEPARNPRKTNSLVMDAKSFDGGNTSRSFKKLMSKISKNESPDQSQTQESILRDFNSDRRKEVSRILQKADSLIVTDRAFIVGNPEGNKSPKRSSKSPKKNAQRSYSRELSFGSESERKGDLNKKLRKTHSMVISDAESIHSTQSFKKLISKIPNKITGERPPSILPEDNVEPKKKVTRKLRKAQSLMTTDLSIDSHGALNSPKKLKKKKTKKIQRSESIEPSSLMDFDIERSPTKAKKFRKAHSLVMDRSMDSFRFGSGVKSSKKLTVKISTKGSKKSIQSSLMDLDSANSFKKLRKAKSLVPDNRSLNSISSPTKSKSSKKSLSKNPKNAPKRSWTQGSTLGNYKALTESSPIRKNTPAKKVTKKPSRAAGNLKETAPVKEVKSVVNGKKALMVTFQKNTNARKATPKKAGKSPSRKIEFLRTNSSIETKSTPKIPSQTRVESPPTFRDHSQILIPSTSTTPIRRKTKRNEDTDSSLQDLSLLRGKSGGSNGYYGHESPNFLVKPLDETLEFSTIKLIKNEPSSASKTMSSNMTMASPKPKNQTASASGKTFAKLVGTPKSIEKRPTRKPKVVTASVNRISATDLYEQVSEKIKQKSQRANC